MEQFGPRERDGFEAFQQLAKKLRVAGGEVVVGGVPFGAGLPAGLPRTLLSRLLTADC